ncbi:MAG TPA: LLM class flavin-dependent oxidoreductase [Actinomycetota bacterium]|jgi:probable F420-dependent oxidoreductase
MRFGLSLPHYGFSLADEPITFPAMASWARRAEALGFDSVWVSDHFSYSFGRYGGDPSPIASLEPLTSLAALAAVTERARLGVLVLGAPFRHPVTVGKMAATIDQVSGGRLELGLGAGWLEQEFDTFGYRFGSVDDRFRALEDSLVVLSGLLREAGPVTYEGSVWSAHEARLLPAPVQRPVPLWVGGKGGPRLLRLAARHATGWNTVWRFTDAWYEERVAAARAICEQEGRDPATFRLTVGLSTLLGDDEAEARAVFERGRASMPGGAMDRDTYEGWCAETLSGTPDRAVDRIGWLASVGVEEIVVSPWVLPFAVPDPELVERFAERVIAPLRAAR